MVTAASASTSKVNASNSASARSISSSSSTAGRGPGCSIACSSGRRSRYSAPNRSVLASVDVARLGQPDAQQLARVVPLVERLAGVDALVALQPVQRRVQHAGQRLGRLRLADARLALQQQRLRAAGRRGTAPWPARRRRGSRRRRGRGQRRDVRDPLPDLLLGSRRAVPSRVPASSSAWPRVRPRLRRRGIPVRGRRKAVRQPGAEVDRAGIGVNGRLAGIAATDMPQTGSIAVAPEPRVPGRLRPEPLRPTAMGSQPRGSAGRRRLGSAGAAADPPRPAPAPARPGPTARSPPACAGRRCPVRPGCAPARAARRSRRGRPARRRRAIRLATRPTYGHAEPQRGRQRRLLPAAVRGDDQRGVVRRAGAAPTPRRTSSTAKPSAAAQRRQRLGDGLSRPRAPAAPAPAAPGRSPSPRRTGTGWRL